MTKNFLCSACDITVINRNRAIRWQIEIIGGVIKITAIIVELRDYAIIPLHICAFILIGAGVLR